MTRLNGKVAFVTGAGHGQGRSHAVRFAEEGADVIAVDLCEPVDTVPYPMATDEDLAETRALVEATGRRIVAEKADVRDLAALRGVVERGVAEFGRLDIVAANAGVLSFGGVADLSEEAWKDVIDVNLTGAWHTIKAALPAMIEAGNGGSISITSSVTGLKGYDNQAHYVSSKHALVGLMKATAREVAQHSIRVNTVHPTSLSSDMLLNEKTYKLFRPELEAPTLDDVKHMFYDLNMLPTPWIEPVDISNALVFLASDEARYITGAAIPVDAGATL